MPELFAALAIGFGITSFVFPAFVSRTIRRAEMQLRAIVRSRLYKHSVLETSRNQVQLTRFLGGWWVLIGLAVTWPSSPHLWLGMVGYTVVFIMGLGYAVFRSKRKKVGATLSPL